MPVICVYKQIDEVAIRTVEEINANVEIAEITGDTQHIVPEYMEKRNDVDRSELEDIFETIEFGVLPVVTQDTEETCGNIEMIKKCIEFLKSSTIFDTFITSHDIEDKLLQIAKKTIQRHDDIGDMLNAIINDFPSELLAIFLIKKFKTIPKKGQKNFSPKGHKKIKKTLSNKQMFSN